MASSRQHSESSSVGGLAGDDGLHRRGLLRRGFAMAGASMLGLGLDATGGAVPLDEQGPEAGFQGRLDAASESKKIAFEGRLAMEESVHAASGREWRRGTSERELRDSHRSI